MSIIQVGIADASISLAGDTLVTYALGSCVGICLWDRVSLKGGLIHIMLPYCSETLESGQGNLYKFADTGIEKLTASLIANGCLKKNIVAKIAGGATMFKGSVSFNIGVRNLEAVKTTLRKQCIPIIAEQTGGDFGRTLYFDPKTGEVQVKSAVRGTVVM